VDRAEFRSAFLVAGDKEFMKFESPQRISDIAELINAEIVGDPTITVTGFDNISRAGAGEVIFADNEKYLALALAGKASVVIIPKTLQLNNSAPPDKVLLLTANAHQALNKIAAAMFSHLDSTPPTGVHPTAIVSSSAEVAEGCSIGAYCIVGDNVSIGGGTILSAHVVIEEKCRIGTGCRIGSHTTIHRRCVLGDGVILESGCHIGAHPFYFYKDAEAEEELCRGSAYGSVEVASGVEMGAGCTIDRGFSGNTSIGLGSKFDNQVHVGHDVRVGRSVLIAAQTGIAGYSEIEDGVVIQGQVGIMQHVKVGKGSEILGKSGVDQDIAENQTVFGIPAFTRERYAQRRRVLRKRVRKLERDAEALRGAQRDFQERVLQAIADEAGREVSEIRMDNDLIADLRFDSLDRVELQMALEEELDTDLVELHLEDEAFKNVKTVKDVVELVSKSLRVQIKSH
jgi:UDP-3-O-[3-hydroxymyristoyl] glucosamine N-acyltransferase